MRLPVLSTVLLSAESSLLEEIVSEVDSEEEMPITELMQGLSEYVFSAEHISNSRTAGALCVYALIKNGFNKNLDCPVKPLLVNNINCIIASSNDFTVTKNCLNFLSLLVSRQHHLCFQSIH